MTNWTKTPRLLESDLQSDIIDLAHALGWFCEKIESRSGRGIMDLYCLRAGRHVWMEVKRSEDEEPTAQQQKRARDMRAQGAEVYCVGSIQEARQILR
jgi:hypothetical protein